jgi:plasmid stabilization system protein ParE
MGFEVVVTSRAQWDLNEARTYIARYAPETAETWYVEFLKALCDLENHPETYPIAAEGEDLPFELRQFLYRTRSGRVNRALFTIVGSQVRVLAIRRPGQRAVSPGGSAVTLPSPPGSLAISCKPRSTGRRLFITARGLEDRPCRRCCASRLRG